eukprot:754971-Hanusia_phi.AAC.6
MADRMLLIACQVSMKKFSNLFNSGVLPPPVPHLDNLSLLFNKKQSQASPLQDGQEAADNEHQNMIEREESYEYETNSSRRYNDHHVLEIVSFGSELAHAANKHKGEEVRPQDTPEALLARALGGNQIPWSRSTSRSRTRAVAYQGIPRQLHRKHASQHKDVREQLDVSEREVGWRLHPA